MLLRVLFVLALCAIGPAAWAASPAAGPALAKGPATPIREGERWTLHSAVLDEDRIVFVGTPASYDRGVRHYPVLYLTDAQFEFDQARSSAQFLARNRLIPETIVVGVVNIDRTRDLYATRADFINGKQVIPFPNSGNGDRFLAFIEQELVPWVDANYRTTPLRLLAGHSAGGNFALHALRTTPSFFQGVMTASPWLPWDDHRELKALQAFLADPKTHAPALFFSYATDPPEVTADIQALAATLRARKGPALRWQLASYPEETHETTSVRSYYDGLRMIFADWASARDPVTNALLGSLPDIEAHFQKVSKAFGVAIPPPEEIVNELGYQDLAAGRREDALSVFRYNTEKHPESANTWDSLGEALEKSGRPDEALTSYRRAVAVAEAQHSPSAETFRAHADRLAARLAPNAK